MGGKLSREAARFPKLETQKPTTRPTFLTVSAYNIAFWQLSNTRICYVKPGPHQQQCRSNVRLCCQKRQQCRTSFALKFYPFDKVERCSKLPKTAILSKQQAKKFRQCWFDIVASVDRALCHIWRPTMSDLATHNVNIVRREKCRPAVSAEKAVSVTAGHECRPLYDIVGITKFSQYCTFVCAAVTDLIS